MNLLVQDLNINGARSATELFQSLKDLL